MFVRSSESDRRCQHKSQRSAPALLRAVTIRGVAQIVLESGKKERRGNGIFLADYQKWAVWPLPQKETNVVSSPAPAKQTNGGSQRELKRRVALLPLAAAPIMDKPGEPATFISGGTLEFCK